MERSESYNLTMYVPVEIWNKIFQYINNPVDAANACRLFRQVIYDQHLGNFFLNEVNIHVGNMGSLVDDPVLLKDRMHLDTTILRLQKTGIAAAREFGFTIPDYIPLRFTDRRDIFLLPREIQAAITDTTRRIQGIFDICVQKNYFIPVKKILYSARISELDSSGFDKKCINAAQRGLGEMTMAFLSCPAVLSTLPDYRVFIAIEETIRKNHKDILKEIFSCKAALKADPVSKISLSHKRSLVRCASKFGHVEMMQELLKDERISSAMTSDSLHNLLVDVVTSDATIEDSRKIVPALFESSIASKISEASIEKIFTYRWKGELLLDMLGSSTIASRPSPDILSNGLEGAASAGNRQVVKAFRNHSRASEISASSLGRTLREYFKDRKVRKEKNLDEEIVEDLLGFPNSSKISMNDLNKARAIVERAGLQSDVLDLFISTATSLS